MDVERLSCNNLHLLDGSQSLLVDEDIVKITLNGDTAGYGIITFNNAGHRAASEPVKVHQPLLTKIPVPATPSVVPFCLQLSNPLCRRSELTGGKASKLADIVAAASKVDSNLTNFDDEMEIPSGFAVSVAAYNRHVEQNPQIKQLIDQVVQLARKHHQNQPTDELDRVVKQLHDAFVNTEISSELKSQIEQNMKIAFGNANWSSTYTAVRSSAVGEDGCEASGAGQMDTILGKQGLNNVIQALKQCWASHYGLRAVLYRRQLCAPLNAPMSVLVQKLINAKVAGVLFTRQPDNGSTASMMINATYGIGEGVVSGTIQPDCIDVYRMLPGQSKPLIVYKSLGEKSSAFRLDTSTGTVHETDNIAKQGECCLTTEQIEELHAIGLVMEHIFGAGADVEFALDTDGRFAILQARPITTSDNECQWELMHEFDTPLGSDNEFITTANVQ